MKRLRPRQYAEILIRAVKGLAEPDLNRVVKNFIRLVDRQRAGKMWPRIMAHLQRLEDRAVGVTRVQVTGRPAADLQYLTELLRAELGPVAVEFTADPTQIGGLKIRVGDDLYDQTLKNQLNNLRLHLSKH